MGQMPTWRKRIHSRPAVFSVRPCQWAGQGHQGTRAHQGHSSAQDSGNLQGGAETGVAALSEPGNSGPTHWRQGPPSLGPFLSFPTLLFPRGGQMSRSNNLLKVSGATVPGNKSCEASCPRAGNQGRGRKSGLRGSRAD